MPVIILIESASSYIPDITNLYKDKYTVITVTGPYPTVRSSLSNQSEKYLYIVPNLTKPERYEIFCLARKNEQQFISIAISTDKDKENGPVSSDKNIIILDQFDADKINVTLSKSRIANTTANKMSKNVSFKGLGDLKVMTKRVNNEFLLKNGEVGCILNECENRIIKMWSLGLRGTVKELEECYAKIVTNELKCKGLLK